MSEPIRIHIENDAQGPAALRLEKNVLEKKLEARPRLSDRFSVSVNDAPDRFAATASDAEILFAARKPASLAPMRRLKWVQSISAGVEALLPLLPEGVILTNASGVHAGKGAEFVLASVLMLNHRIPRFASDKQERRWDPHYGGTVGGKTAMLLGVGAIGTAAAVLLKKMGLSTIGVTRSGGPRDGIDRPARFGDIDALLPEVDFLISSLPLTPETAGLIDRSRLDLLPARAGVVVVGRAQVFDYAALADKLGAGTLAGAVLDVFAEEPLPPGDRLWETPGLIMTPHCSLDDHTLYIDACLGIFLDNLERHVSGERLLNVVDRAAGY